MFSLTKGLRQDQLSLSVSSSFSVSQSVVSLCPIRIFKKVNFAFGVAFTRFPTVNSAPASSVPSEQLFSKTGLIYDPQRSRLDPSRAEKLLFIKANLPLFEFMY